MVFFRARLSSPPVCPRKAGMRHSAQHIFMRIFRIQHQTRLLALSGALISSLAGAELRADPADFASQPEPAPKTVLRGVFELSVGALVLPNAEVCSEEGCRRGDASPLLEGWALARFPGGIALGGGATLGLFPVTLPPQTQGDVFREDSRSYLTFEATGRYYFRDSARLKPWLGLGLGLVVLSDRFISAAEKSSQTRIGAPGYTINTEGLSYFGGTGFEFALSHRWSFGGSLRLGGFQFPSTPKRSPLGDEASLTGANFYASAGLNFAVHADL